MNSLYLPASTTPTILDLQDGLLVGIRYPAPEGVTLGDLARLVTTNAMELKNMIDNLTDDVAALQSAQDAEIAETRALAKRVDDLNRFKDAALEAKANALAAAEAQRDAAVAELEKISAAAAAVPGNTKALEAQIKTMIENMRGNTEFMRALDAMPDAPVSEPTPAPAVEPPPVVAEPPVATEPTPAVDPLPPVAVAPGEPTPAAPEPAPVDVPTEGAAPTPAEVPTEATGPVPGDTPPVGPTPVEQPTSSTVPEPAPAAELPQPVTGAPPAVETPPAAPAAAADQQTMLVGERSVPGG